MMVEVSQIEIPLDPEAKGILVFRGITQEEAKQLMWQIREWYESGRPFCMIGLPRSDMEVKFIRADKDE